jgi:hypothetical protein
MKGNGMRVNVFLALLVVFFCSIETVFSVAIKTEDVVSVRNGNIQRVMINIYPYLSEIKKETPQDLEVSIKDLAREFVKNSYAGDKEVQEVDLQIVMIKDMDEYARPNFADLSRISKIAYCRDGADFKEIILEMNVGLLKS